MNSQIRAPHMREPSASETSKSAKMLAAIARLAAGEPEQLLDQLEWSVQSDLGILNSFPVGESPARAFQSANWLNAWIDANAIPSEDLRIITGHFGSQPVIVLPLYVERAGGLVRARFVAHSVSDYNHPIIHEAVLPHVGSKYVTALYERALALLPAIDILSLRKLLVEPRNSPLLSGVEAHGAHWTEFRAKWTDDEQRYFGKSSRRSLSRKHRKIEGSGKIETGQVTDPQAIQRAVDQLCEWKRSQLDGLGLANRFGRDEFRRFLRNIAAAGAPDQVRVYSLTAGGVPLAVTLMICEKKRWLLYQTAYTNDALGHLSPGLILLRHIMHQANDAGAEIFDFGLGDEPYKNKFCEVHITLSWAERPNTLKGWIAGLAAAFIAWLRHRAKHDSFARRLATTMLNLPKRFQTASNPKSG